MSFLPCFSVEGMTISISVGSVLGYTVKLANIFANFEYAVIEGKQVSQNFIDDSLVYNLFYSMLSLLFGIFAIYVVSDIVYYV